MQRLEQTKIWTNFVQICVHFRPSDVEGLSSQPDTATAPMLQTRRPSCPRQSTRSSSGDHASIAALAKSAHPSAPPAPGGRKRNRRADESRKYAESSVRVSPPPCRCPHRAAGPPPLPRGPTPNKYEACAKHPRQNCSKYIVVETTVVFVIEM